jgi:hypothetical protein
MIIFELLPGYTSLRALLLAYYFSAYFLQIPVLPMQLRNTAACFVNYLCRTGKPGSESGARFVLLLSEIFLLSCWFNGTLSTYGRQIIIIFGEAYKIAKYIN